jgi:putative tricarboxylic transport membrane protein
MTTTQRRAPSWGELAAAGAASALGLALLVGAREISFAAGYDRIGPRFFPYAVGVGLIALGIALAARAALGRPPRAETALAGSEGDPISWRPLGLVIVALVFTVLLLERAGFVIASAVQLWLVARAFGSKRPARDAVVAVLLPSIVYYAFSRGLGLSLPAGLLERFS